VSIFLQEKVQNSDGTFKIFIGGPVIAGGDIPGMKRIYDKNDNLIQESGNIFDWAEDCMQPLKERNCNLGNNMYENEKSPNLQPSYGKNGSSGKSKKAIRRDENDSSVNSSKNNNNNNTGRSPVQRVKPSVPYNNRGVKASPSNQTGGRAELNLLANLLGHAVEETEGKAGDEEDGDNDNSNSRNSKFTLNLNFDLFSDDNSGGGKNERVAQRVSIDAKATRKSVQQQMADLGFDDDDDGDTSLTGGGGKRSGSGNSKGNDSDDDDDDDSDDDLLDLMDMASKK